MTVIIEGTLNNLFQTNEYKNQETGEITPSKQKAQLMTSTKLKNGGIKNELIDLSLKDDVASELKDKVGKVVQVKCGMMSKSPITFYGV